MQERVDVVVRQFLAAAEEVEFDDEAVTRDVSTEFLDQPRHCGSRAARREHVIDDQHALAVLDRILMNLKTVGAVLEFVLPELDFARELLRLADGNESRA